MEYMTIVERYEKGLISQEKAAEVAGLSRYAFLKLLAHYEVSAVQYTPELLEEELRYVCGESSP